MIFQKNTDVSELQEVASQKKASFANQQSQQKLFLKKSLSNNRDFYFSLLAFDS